MKKTIVSIIMFLVSLPVYVLLIAIFIYWCIWFIPIGSLFQVTRINTLSDWFEKIDRFFMQILRKFIG